MFTGIVCALYRDIMQGKIFALFAGLYQSVKILPNKISQPGPHGVGNKHTHKCSAEKRERVDVPLQNMHLCRSIHIATWYACCKSTAICCHCYCPQNDDATITSKNLKRQKITPEQAFADCPQQESICKGCIHVHRKWVWLFVQEHFTP